MLRYYDLLSNIQIRHFITEGKALKITVYKQLKLTVMMKEFFRTDTQYKCILCEKTGYFTDTQVLKQATKLLSKKSIK